MSLADVELPIIDAPSCAGQGRRSACQTDSPISTSGLLQLLLDEQRQLTAVDLFSRSHTAGVVPAQARYYEKLLPASPPGAGQQYAFEVDLDRCSGCKACVVACHSLNGLDEHETWRDVGLLVGGTASNPVMQHVTTACHHCLEPACMIACPVNAYEKDAATGIVRHLDDQCFGCQYCTLACPYDVPKYHAGKGIVRKCDMCSDRLAVGEAPACVQSCPHEAISIKVVTTAQVRENAEVDPFLPAAPEPYLTYPTTTFRTRRVFPRNTLPADYYAVNPQHPHWPLIIMLVLTQLSVGTFGVGTLLGGRLGDQLPSLFQTLHASLALVLGLVALGASTLHLGRPQYAFRAILGLKHSWLSREIVAFGLFAGAASLFAASIWLDMIPRLFQPAIGLGVVATGALGLVCSAMIYVFTQREFWSFGRTLTRFLLTAGVLGLATTWLTLLLAVSLRESADTGLLLLRLTSPLATELMVVASVKLVWEAAIFLRVLERRNSPLRRSATLMLGPLASYSMARFAFGLLGGVLMPAFLLSIAQGAEPPASFDLQATIVVGMLFVACLGGELLERYLFFAAVSAPRMPGGPRS
ncbi:MAG: DmsC/YnfH family molybdoenzyme membrane anchor subunit [Planctomycetaceae bacterium]